MVEVNLWGGLRVHTGGCAKIEVEATTVGEVLNRIADLFPVLADYLKENVSVVVDGRLIVSSLQEPVAENSEVWLIKRVRGG